MKFLKALLIFIFAIMLLILGIFAAGAVNPDLSDKIADFLYHNKKTAAPFYDTDGSGQTVSDSSNEEDLLPDDYYDIFPETTDSNTHGYDDGHNDVSNPSHEGILDIPSSYIAPIESDLNIPDSVSGLNGYESPVDNGHEVEEPKAQDIEQELGYGQTGDGLSFDALTYPYYQMLDEDGQALYRQIFANSNALIDRFKPVVKCTPGKVKNVFEAVIGDHPELFWMNTAYSTITRPGGGVVEIDLSFNQTASNLDSAKQKFNQAADEILSSARTLTSDFDKEKYIHDALADKIDYNLSAPMNQSAYSALVNNSTVCAGYARAMQYLCQQLNIPCYYCTGFAGENHAWNIIKLDDDYYNVDVTWDDSAKGCYDYFNKSDSIFNRDHMRKNLSVYLPACNGTGYQVESKQEDEDNTNPDSNNDNYYFIDENGNGIPDPGEYVIVYSY